MDTYTEQHLERWLAKWVAEDERAYVGSRMRDVVADYPDVLATSTWGQIARMAGFEI